MWRSCSPRSPDLWGARPCSWEGQRLAVPRRGERPGRWGSAGGPGSGDPPPARAAFSIRDGEAIPRPLRQKRGALSDAGGRGRGDDPLYTVGKPWPNGVCVLVFLVEGRICNQ